MLVIQIHSIILWLKARKEEFGAMDNESIKFFKSLFFLIIVLLLAWFIFIPIADKSHEVDYKRRDQATEVIVHELSELGMPGDTEISNEMRDQEGRTIHSTIIVFYTTKKSSQDIMGYYRCKAVEKGWSMVEERKYEKENATEAEFSKNGYTLLLRYSEEKREYTLSMRWTIKSKTV